MKILVLIVIVSMCQNASSFELFNYMRSKFDEFAGTLVTTFRDFTDKVKNLLGPNTYSYADDTPVIMDPEVVEPRISRSFDHFVAETEGVTLDDYKRLQVKNEPTAIMSAPQLAVVHGRKMESHVIKTHDAYLLTLHRIPNKIITENSNAKTIILHHGLLGSSADWILLGPKKSLPYILSDDGYDVWMVNARGNYYSRGHLFNKIDSPAYWKFSFQEMGLYDLPAAIDYIRKLKNSTIPIDYIGHSMGATSLLVLLSTTPRYNQYLRIGVLLAPLAFMTNIKGPLKEFTTMSEKVPELFRKIIDEGEFVPLRKIPNWLTTKYCNGPKLFCANPLLFFAGIPQEKGWNTSFIARLMYHVPAGGSTRTIMHYGRLAESGKFHWFDDINKEFMLSKVTLPMVLFSSSEDWLASIPDVLRLYFSIQNPLDHYIIRGKNITHTDFVWGAEADTLIFPRVMEFLNNDITDNASLINVIL